jgi:hypothetical protein
MQPYNAYAIGQTILLEGKATDDQGDPVEPVTPQILLKDPTGEETSLDVTLSVVVGTFFHELFINGPPGFYQYRLVTADDAVEKLFYVNASAFEAPLG